MSLRAFWSRLRNNWPALSVGIGSLVDLDGRATLRRLQQLRPLRRSEPSDGTRRPMTDHELTTGLAGYCRHGVGMLDQCDQCSPEEKI